MEGGPKPLAGVWGLVILGSIVSSARVKKFVIFGGRRGRSLEGYAIWKGLQSRQTKCGGGQSTLA